MKSALNVIKVFACVIIVVSVYVFLYLFSIYFYEVQRRYIEFSNYRVLNDEHMLLPLGLCLFVLLISTTGFGLYNHKKWAKKLYLILITLMGFGYAFFAFICREVSLIRIFIVSFVLISSFYFLTRSNIREQFRG